MYASFIAAAFALSVTTNAPFATQFPATPVEGKVVVECIVAAQGSLSDCVVVEETPVGHGLGQKALEASAKLKMDTPMVDGVPVGGAHVRVPFTFKL